MGADVETGGSADPVQLRLVHAGLEQPLAPPLLVPARAERADVVGLRRDRADQQRDVELVVVCEHDDRGRVVRLGLGECLFRPRHDDLVCVRQALPRREPGAGVGDDGVPAERARRRAERVGRVDGAVDEQPRRRSEDIREDASAPWLDDLAVA